MKKLLLCLIFWALAPLSLQAQGTVRQDETLQSRILGRTVNYSVYLPPSYQQSTRHYPVLYLLHGMGDDHRGWSQQGEVQAIADRAIAEGISTEMIIVMPDAGQGWYVNRHDGTSDYEDMFFQELIPQIEAAFRALPEREYRAVAGLSMGGHGALLYALHHPDLFSTACALSAGVYTPEEIAARSGSGAALFRSLFGENLPNDYWRANSPYELMQTLPVEQLGRVRYWIDCGDDDFLYKGNSMLHILMRERNIPHEYRVRDGGHTWTYWRTALPAVLEYISIGFRRS